ncbi:GNAT family N-acetyltransferase [Novosphingobium jiangmenense]|uniref:GNAT family N-acetyltransferase n=1 Tax=Novosphingobium jiangmenense TaxID=2791981 RepID=A0ABS0HD71_9SPHN|nr:GNAT family N-acetyltransferase [Novosphingobium jiangmenense]MBF9150228.1 GNAT family N-acetyltransferase [Novosphingobium jiangmenense]
MLPGIRAEWEELHARHGSGLQSTSPAYCLLALSLALPENASPAFVTARKEGKLCGIWPMWLVNESGRKIARHVGNGSSEEYAGPLACDDAAITAMLKTARGLCDVLHATNVSPESPLVRAAKGWRAHAALVLSPVARCSEAGSWDRWLAGRTRSFRQGWRWQKRRLAALGDVRFGKVELAEIDDFVDQLFELKCQWLSERTARSSWLQTPQARRFAKAAMADPQTGLAGHAIWKGARLVAGGLCLEGKVHDYMVTAYDPVYAQHSPGHVLTGLCVARAIEQGCDFDFRITHDPYKMRWIDEFAPSFTVTFANSVPGLMALPKLYMRDVRRWLSRLYRNGLRRAMAR